MPKGVFTCSKMAAHKNAIKYWYEFLKLKCAINKHEFRVKTYMNIKRGYRGYYLQDQNAGNINFMHFGDGNSAGKLPLNTENNELAPM